MPMHPGGSRAAAMICLLLAGLMTLGHMALLALGVVAIFYGVSKTELVKKWSGNAFNLLLSYVLLSVAIYLVLGLVDLIFDNSLQGMVGDWARYIFSAVFGLGAVFAALNKYFGFPTPSWLSPMYS